MSQIIECKEDGSIWRDGILQCLECACLNSYIEGKREQLTVCQMCTQSFCREHIDDHHVGHGESFRRCFKWEYV